MTLILLVPGVGMGGSSVTAPSTVPAPVMHRVGVVQPDTPTVTSR